MSPFFRNSLKIALLAALAIAIQTRTVAGQTQTADAKGPTLTGSASLSQAQIDDIIRKFTAKETEFRRALNSYAFKRDALIQELGMGGQVVGEYHRVSDFTFDDHGARFEKIGFFPMPSIQGFAITNEDLEDLGGVNPFALEGEKAAQYSFKYVGKEKIDELDLYVFDVAPKVMPSPKSKDRVFVGRIWVDDRDLQIVKAKGKAGPETKSNKFPVVETYREQIDGKYWFPTYVYADDDLVFDNGTDVRIRMRVKYSDFVVGRGKVTIREIGEAPTDIKPESETKPEATGSPKTTSPATQDKTTKPPTNDDEEPPADVGFLNGSAIDLPKPVYPAEAKKDHITGQVQVKVSVDETGKVTSAEIMSGPGVLQAAALEAAKRARFQPHMVNGVAVKVFGVVTYDFTGQ
jgi:TonB family protein